MPELEDREPYLEKLRADSPRAPWYRERLIVFASTNGPNATETLRTAFRTVADITSAPFVRPDERIYSPVLDFLIASASLGQGNESRDLGAFFGAYSDEEGVVFRPRRKEMGRSNALCPGVFLGTALFVPPETSGPASALRGLVELVMKSDDGHVRARFRPCFLGVPGSPAGWFQGQDRAVFGYSRTMPVQLVQTEGQEIDLDAHVSGDIFILIPPVRGTPPTLHVYSACAKAAGYIKNPDGQDLLGQPVFSLVNPSTASERSLTLNMNPETEVGTADVSQILIAPTTNDGKDITSAELQVIPNTEFSRLRHDPAQLEDWGYFTVTGILLPSPATVPSVIEVSIHVQSATHLTAHGLDQLQTSAVIRRPFGRFGQSWDQVVVAVGDKRPDQFNLNRSDAFEPIHSDFGLHLLTRDGGSGELIGNPVLGTSTKLHELLPQGEFYLFKRSTNDRSLGFFACPVLPRASARDKSEKYQADSPVRYVRSRPGTDALATCLDWLDDAVQVITRSGGVTGHAGNETTLGYAQWWNSHVSAVNSALAVDQKFGLISVSETPDPENQAYSLGFTEGIGDAARSLVLEEGSSLRIGPLICTWVSMRGEN